MRPAPSPPHPAKPDQNPGVLALRLAEIKGNRRGELKLPEHIRHLAHDKLRQIAEHLAPAQLQHERPLIPPAGDPRVPPPVAAGDPRRTVIAAVGGKNAPVGRTRSPHHPHMMGHHQIVDHAQIIVMTQEERIADGTPTVRPAAQIPGVVVDMPSHGVPKRALGVSSRRN